MHITGDHCNCVYEFYCNCINNLEDALIAFKEFLGLAKRPVLLVAHNVKLVACRLVYNI